MNACVIVANWSETVTSTNLLALAGSSPIQDNALLHTMPPDKLRRAPFGTGLLVPAAMSILDHLVGYSAIDHSPERWGLDYYGIVCTLCYYHR
jgi:hypothetical protein